MTPVSWDTLLSSFSGKHPMFSVLFIVATVYLVILATGIFLSERMMFQPPVSSYTDTAEIIKLNSREGSVISARMFENRAARYTILFSHGNAEDMGDLTDLLEEFKRQGFSAFAYDYSGYGTSTGRPSENAAYRNIEAAYEYLVTTRGIPADRIIVWGRSIGSGPSVYLAAARKVGGLVIESGFTSAFRVVTRIRLLPFDRFDNLQSLQRISCPLLVIHGKNDEIIPFRHGESLYRSFSGKKMHYWVDGAGHNDLGQVAGTAYWETAQQFARMLDVTR